MSDSSIEIKRSTADGTIAKLVFATLMAVLLGYLFSQQAVKLERPSAIASQRHYILLLFATFLVFWTLAVIYQWAFPSVFTTTISSESVTFTQSDSDTPQVRLERRNTVRISQAEPPQWRGPKRAASETYVFEMSDGEHYRIDDRYIWTGNQNEFAEAIETIWNWPSLPKIQEIKLGKR